MKKLIIVLSFILTLAVLSSCDGNSMKSNIEKSLVYHLSFDDDNDYVKEGISGNQYYINYVYNDAKTKKSEYARRSEGITGKALMFDGYSTYVEGGTINNISKDFTISFYLAPRGFETTTNNSYTNIFSNLTYNSGFEFGIGNYGKCQFIVNTTKGSYKILSNSLYADLYKWNYFSIVYSSRSEGTVSIYKNSSLVIEYELHGAKPIASDTSLTIGRSNDGMIVDSVFNTNYFSGLLDEFKVYNIGLNKEMINDSYINKELDVKKDLWLDEEVLSTDRYCPQYHLKANQFWQNEAYGLLHYNGKYHVFIQENVIGPYYTDGQRWGHLVSSDLVHWEQEIPALIPEDNSIDKNSIFSGCATLDNFGNPIIFYTGVNYGSKKINQISSAVPSDLNDSNLVNWNKSGQVVIDQGNLSTKDNFRDPFIYKENGQYYMLIGGTNENNASIFCYKAANQSLTKWEYLGITYQGNNKQYSFLGNCFELPNLFKVYNETKTSYKYVLMFSPINGGTNGAYYLVGNFDLFTGEFIPDKLDYQKIDLGPKDQVLCPSGFYDEVKDRNIFVTMSRSGLTPQERYDYGWTNISTLCKELYLDKDLRVSFRPIKEYESLEKEELLNLSNISISDGNQALQNIKGDMLKVELEIKPNSDNKVGLYVKNDYEGIEKVFISYDLKDSNFYVDNSKSSTSMRNNGSGGGKVEITGDILKFTVYIDRAMVEAYINDLKEITSFSYNQSANSNGVMIYSSGSTAKIINLRVTSLNSCYEKNSDAFWK